MLAHGINLGVQSTRGEGLEEIRNTLQVITSQAGYQKGTGILEMVQRENLSFDTN